MTMTRKDFISIATAIDESTIKGLIKHTDGMLIDKKTFINSMCIILKANNHRFDSTRFISACNSHE